jgi:hypothetical protein
VGPEVEDEALAVVLEFDALPVEAAEYVIVMAVPALPARKFSSVARAHTPVATSSVQLSPRMHRLWVTLMSGVVVLHPLLT